MPQLTRLKQLTRLTALGGGGAGRWWESLPGQAFLTRDGQPYQTSDGAVYWGLPEAMAYLTTDQGLYLATDAGYYLTVGGYTAFDGALYST